MGGELTTFLLPIIMDNFLLGTSNADICQVSGGNKRHDTMGFPTAIEMERSCDIQRDRYNPELSAGNASGTDTQRGSVFEPPQ
jgi:hypothetical protein